MESWFRYPSTIKELLDHIDVICMVKDHANVFYQYNGKLYRLSHLYNALKNFEKSETVIILVD